MGELFRRSPHLVCYWKSGRFVIENYMTRSRVAATALHCELLNLFDDWRPASAVAKPFADQNARRLARVLTDLVHTGLLERSPGRRAGEFPALGAWSDWSPSASYFHFSTKDAHAPIEPDDSLRRLRRRARARPLPPPVKRYPRSRQIPLPPPDTGGPLAEALLHRRTWRRFSDRPLDVGQLATLLGLTFRVQAWLETPRLGRLALKTSPSGGARHPIEAYVLVLRTRGLRRGLYHYDAAGHVLARLREGATPGQLVRYLNGQWWFGDAGALVLMTAVFARTQWKYPAPRAYRVVLIDAGHLCQTFCTVATALGLAPFSTMALSDSLIERDLGIDGVSESIIYTAGVGTRPVDTSHARWPTRPSSRVVSNPLAGSVFRDSDSDASGRPTSPRLRRREATR